MYRDFPVILSRAKGIGGRVLKFAGYVHPHFDKQDDSYQDFDMLYLICRKLNLVMVDISNKYIYV